MGVTTRPVTLCVFFGGFLRDLWGFVGDGDVCTGLSDDSTSEDTIQNSSSVVLPPPETGVPGTFPGTFPFSSVCDLSFDVPIVYPQVIPYVSLSCRSILDTLSSSIGLDHPHYGFFLLIHLRFVFHPFPSSPLCKVHLPRCTHLGSTNDDNVNSVYS